MDNKENKYDKKDIYTEPKIIAIYTKEELEETIKPHGPVGYPDNNFNSHPN
jgi:hypothetical protein